MGKIQNRQNRIAFLLIPIVGALVIFRLFPVTIAFFMSLYRTNGVTGQFIGLDNYIFFLKDRIAVKSLVNTFFYVLMYVPANICIALFLAVMIQSVRKGKSFFRVAHFLPVVMSIVAASVLWKWIYQPQFGLFSAITRFIGIGPVRWLEQTSTAMPSIVIMSLWKSIGTNLVLFIAGLTGIPAVFHEAATIDGCTSWGKFRHITFPLLRPTLLFVTVISIIGSLQIFAQVIVMTKGAPDNSTRVFVQHIREVSFLSLTMGYGAALSFILFIIIVILTFIQFRIMRINWEY